MKVIIIGGVAAGTKAASKLKRLLPEANITIYTDDTHVSYSSCGMPYYIEGNFDDYRMLLVRSVEEFNALGINVNINSKVTKIIPSEKAVKIYSNDTYHKENYDKLIIATGARAYIPQMKNYSSKLKNVFTIRKIEDAINIKNKLKTTKKAVILGSGFIGLEMLEALVKNNIHVTMIERNDHMLSALDTEISLIARKNLELVNDNNFEVSTNEEITEFIVNDDYNVIRVKTTNGRLIDTDMVIICSGVVPNTEIAAEAGIKLGVKNSIKVNKLMQTSIPNIYACGDCVEKYHIVTNKAVWIPLGSTANKEGRCCAINVAGGYEEFNGVLGSIVTRCLNTTIALTGITEANAREIGYTPVSVIVNKSDIVGYMPNVGEITLKIIADKITGLLLGAQAVGSIGADKRINSVATALLAKMTVEQYSASDFTYSPPFSPTIDPLLNAVQKLKTLVYD